MTASQNHHADRFVGRQAELTTLRDWLDRGERLVTVWGPPGIGKTRLALELLHEVDCNRPGAPTWHCVCDLSTLEDQRWLISTVANCLGIDPPSGRGRAGPDVALRRALAARGRGLLILDNVERVTDGVARSVAGWLDAARELTVLSTSRERLRTAGEVCMELGSLTLPGDRDAPSSDAVALFFERARAQDPAFGAGCEDDRFVAQLVRLLDGIPLAIELAAARVGVMSVEELVRRVSTGIDVLSRGVRSASSRQATLRGAVQWSWDLLSPVERAVLARCSAFRGRFGLAAAEAVLRDACGAESVLDVLHALRDKSMLRVRRETGETRFEIYFGIREFAAEQLELSGQSEATRTRHARVYVAAAAAARAEMEQSGRSDEVHLLAMDKDNLFAAYEFLDGVHSDTSAESVLSAIVALEPVLLSRGPVEQLLEMVERYMTRPDARSVGPVLYARGMHARARALQLSGSLDAAQRDFGTALGLLPVDADRWQKAALLMDAGMLHHQRRNLDQARDCYTQALDLYEGGDSIRQQARVLGDIGALHHDQREFDVASKYYQRALHHLRRAEEPRLEGNILANLGLLASESGRFDEADAYLTRAEATLEKASDRRLLGIVRGNRGALALERGELEVARETLGLAIRDLAEFGDSSSQALCLARHAAVEASLSDTNDWWAHSFAAERLIDADEDPLTLAAVRLYAALAELASTAPPSSDTLQRVRARVASAREPRPDSGLSLADLSDDVRAALRLLERRLARIEPLSERLRGVPADALVVGPDGTWFRPPGGVSQSLGSHGPVRRILLALSLRSGAGERAGLSLDELREIGWPGEKIQPEAAANRVHVALAELRRRGLKAYLVRLPKGYALSDRVTIHRSDVVFPETP
jgi:predicted ATPase/Tfp pilus assembly protein PilF